MVNLSSKLTEAGEENMTESNISKMIPLGERINFTQDYIAQRKKSNKEQKLIDLAFSEISFKDERGSNLPKQWGCTEENWKRKKEKRKFKTRKDSEFYPFRRKRYKFRQSKTFKNPEKRYEKYKGRRYWKKNDSTSKKVPN